MRRVVVVQARMTSTRLPGKILLDLCGQPMLARQLERLRACTRVDEVCVATTDQATDEPIVALAKQLGVACFRGDEHDVLSRFVGAGLATRAELVVRVTSDCPLLDPAVTDRVIERATEPDPRCDYASNTMERTFPRGLDAEAVYLDALVRSARLATSRPAREHVTWFLHRERPELFVTRQVVDPVDNSDLRWTVDAPEDLALVRRIYEVTGSDRSLVPYPDVLAAVRARPELTQINAGIEQKKD
jgi:spore coat polysaccharide biosynthesis protein SpsF